MPTDRKPQDPQVASRQGQESPEKKARDEEREKLQQPLTPPFDKKKPPTPPQ